MLNDGRGGLGVILLSVFLGAVPVAAGAQTVLSISGTGLVTVAADQVLGRLTVQAEDADSAVAQGKVNGLMRQALDLARATAGVTATTSDYSTYQENPGDGSNGPGLFHASQTLELVMPAKGGVPSGAFGELLREIQAKGLLLTELDGTLSARAEAQAEQVAIADAIHDMQARAATVATTLGETVGGIKDLTVNTEGAQMPRMLWRGVVMAAPTPAVAPQSAPGKLTVSASVSATVQLRAGRS